MEALETILFGALPEVGQHTEWIYNVMRQMYVPNSQVDDNDVFIYLLPPMLGAYY